MRVPRKFQPEGALADLRYFFGRRQPHQILFFALALVLTLVAIALVAHDSRFTPEYHRDIVYVEQWPLTRTDKEIIAQQKVDAVIKARRLEAEDRERKANQAKFKAIDDKLKKWGHLSTAADARYMAAALALAERGRGRTAPNPNVGCVVVRDGRVVGRGWTQPGGRPHAEAMALHQAGAAAGGATAYVTLEPCAHRSPRGPACADLLVAAGVSRVVAALRDPDQRTDGRGCARLADAGVAVETGLLAHEARRSMAGFLTRRAQGRPLVTLKLATSLDGCIALASGESRWITGPEARAHAHLERSRHEAILVGRGTWEADAPELDVRLAGLEERPPVRVVLSASHPHPAGASRLPPFPGGKGRSGAAAKGEGEPIRIVAPQDIAALPGDHLLVEGGARTAAAFLRADLIDRFLIYRAPILIGGGTPALADIGLTTLTETHGRWKAVDARQLGADRLEVYERA